MVVACTMACGLSVACGVSAAASEAPPTESVATFEHQLDGAQILAVTLHTNTHAFHAALKDGGKVRVLFEPSQQQQLLNAVKAHGITVKVAKVQTPSHTRRDIVIIAVVVVVIVLILVAIWLLMRRRRMREEEFGPGAPMSSP